MKFEQYSYPAGDAVTGWLPLLSLDGPSFCNMTLLPLLTLHDFITPGLRSGDHLQY